MGTTGGGEGVIVVTLVQVHQVGRVQVHQVGRVARVARVKVASPSPALAVQVVRQAHQVHLLQAVTKEDFTL